MVADALAGAGEANGSVVLKNDELVELSASGVVLPCWLWVRFIAEIGIFSRPLGDDANGEVAVAEEGTLVDKDNFGADPPADEGAPSEPCVVGDAPGFKRDDICCSDGSRAILGLYNSQHLCCVATSRLLMPGLGTHGVG